MIGIIARKELREIGREARFRWSAAAVLLLLGAALASGVAGTRRATAERTAAIEADRREWLRQGPRNPQVAAHFGMYAFKPAAPLALFDRGVETFTGTAIWIEAHNQNPAQFRAADDATSMIRFGELTAAAVLQTLAPLLIIVVGFPLFAGERERGTLRQLLSLGITPARLAAGKAAGALAALAFVLVPAIVIGVTALSLTGEIPFARLLFLAGAYGTYFLAIAALVIAVSARASTSRAALVMLLGFWIVITFVIPRTAADFGERLHPTPTDRQFWAAVNEDIAKGIDGHNPADARREALEQRDPFTSRVTMLTGRHKLFSQWQLANPLTLLAGRFDLAFLIVYLFPLLIVALTYNVLSSEREQGTLVMVLSQPVRLRTLLAAKIGAPGAWTALARGSPRRRSMARSGSGCRCGSTPPAAVRRRTRWRSSPSGSRWSSSRPCC